MKCAVAWIGAAGLAEYVGRERLKGCGKARPLRGFVRPLRGFVLVLVVVLVLDFTIRGG
jgi:hypothetical protein